MDLNQVSQLLLSTLDPSVGKQAEQQLYSIEKSSGFVIILLQILKQHTEPHVCSVSAVYFKNFVKKYWIQDNVITDADKDYIKTHIVDIMISVPPSIQIQLSEAVTLIANSDFPSKWSELVSQLVSKLEIQDYNVHHGVLKTAHAIFKRWRHAFRSNELFSEIKDVLNVFCVPFTKFIKETDNLIDANASQPQILVILLESMLLCTKIFYSLNVQDLPEYFEDHQNEFFGIFQKYLQYSNPLLDSGDDELVGPLEKLKASICEIIDLYATKYESEFSKLPEFIQIIWNVCTSVGLEPKYDYLMSKAIAFLTCVVKPSRLAAHFESPETLMSIISLIILPNMTLRESDLELFEDDPLEFIRRDLEGSDSDTRRRAASDFIRGLLEHFAKSVTDICSQYINQALASYTLDPKANFKSKDTALYLMTALCARSLTIQSGATVTNEFIEILPVFASQIVPDLSVAVDGVLHPIIKVDVIKYLLIFRSQLSKQQLLDILPCLVNHLNSKNYVVYTYAAVCLERILSIKSNNVFLFKGSDIAHLANPTLLQLFKLIESGKTPAKLAENDYLIKTIMRIILLMKTDIAPLVEPLIGRLTSIISVISKSPSNPKFNHYAFETLASLVKYSCISNPSLVYNFETFLFPPFQEILSQEGNDFMPFCFQILAQLLNYRPVEGVLAPQYSQMLPFFLSSALWESYGNVPALVSLLSTYLAKGSNEIVSKGQLSAVLGIVQRLISSKLNDHYGFELLNAIVEHVEVKQLEPFIKNILVLLIRRLSEASTPKYVQGFLNFLCFLFVIKKPGLSVDDVLTMMDSITPRLAYNIFSSVIRPAMNSIPAEDWALCTVGLTNLLSSQFMLSDSYFPLWEPFLSSTLDLIQNPLSSTTIAQDDELQVLDLQFESGHVSNYSKLTTASTTTGKKNVTAHVPDPKMYFIQSLATLSSCCPGRNLEMIIQRELSNPTFVQLKDLYVLRRV